MAFDQLGHEQSNDSMSCFLSLKSEMLHHLPNQSSLEDIFRGLIDASPIFVILEAAVSTDHH